MLKRITLLMILLCAGLSEISAQVISGSITDADGAPLPGASVVIKEQPGVGATTDFDGKYIISGITPGTVTLEISFIGFETKQFPIEIGATDAKTVDVKLQESSSELDEVVVVGYGVQRKRDVTGSMVSLSSKDITETPTQSFETSIQGKAAGVQVITGSGLAGSGSVVRVRGVASISASGDPLYVVDGIPITQDYFLKGSTGGMNNNPLATINPNDIEDVQILKDAAATAIYGSRGANGVILITTKRGKKGGLKFNFNTSFGISEPTKLPDMLNTDEYLQLYEEAWVNDGNTGTPDLLGTWTWEDAQRYNTDWVDQTIQTGFKQNYDFNVQKGSEKYNFYAGVSYSNNESYLKGNSYERLSGRINGDYRFSDKLKLGFSTSLSQGDNNRIDAAWSGGLGSAMSTSLPYYPVYWDEELIASRGDTEHEPGDYYIEDGINNNPVAARELKSWRTREIRSISTVNLNYNPTQRLSFVLSGSYDRMNLKEDLFYSYEYLREVDNDTNSNLTGGKAERYPLVANNFNTFLTGAYDFKTGPNHKLKVLLGTEFQERETKSYYMKTDNGGATNEFYNVDGPAYSTPISDFDSVSVSDRYRFLSYFGRLNYEYKSRYLLQLVLRSDGSSKFGPDNRFGFFPSIGAGWILSEENFLKNNRVINFAKLKASYGYTGNAGLPSDQWRSVAYIGAEGYNGQDIRYLSILPNSDLQWETSRVIDLSLEFGLYGDRITGQVAYYNKYTDGVFIGVELPGSDGYGSNVYYDNIAEIENYGYEFELKTRNLTGELQWRTDFNIAFNRNEVKDLGGYSPDAILGGTNDTRVVVGEPVGANYLVKFSHVDQETGQPVYFDIDGNETYTWDPDNRVVVGSILPVAVGGINNYFRYKNFDLSFLFVYSFGGKIYDSSSKRQLGRVDEWNKTELIYDRWQEPGDDATYAALTLDEENLGSNTPWINTDQWLHDASYIRLRNVIIGWNLPSQWFKKAKVSNARLTLTGTNLLTFTEYPGLDPEVARDFDSAADRNLSPNVTYLTPPQERSYMIGLNVTF